MKTAQFQNTICCKGPKYYNNVMINNLLKFKNVYNI